MLNRKFMLNRKIYFSIISILWTILNVLNMAALDMADRTVFLFAQSPNSGVDQKRLETDWIQQDSGHNEITSCFISGQNNETEKKLVTKVFKELSDFGVKTEPLQKEYDALSKIPGNDKRWKDLYLRACRIRRVNRLASLRERNRQIIFVKNEILTGSGNFQSSFFDTDSQNSGKPMIWNPVDSKLCLLTVDENGETALTTLCEQLKGSIRDPELSFDAKTLFFSMRTDFEKDNYQIYSMNLENRQLKQITHNPRDEKTVYPTANIEPCCLPNGRIFYISTRCGQLDPCSWAHAGNLYSCLADGSDIRRIGLDQVTVLGPKVLSDGRILYTRWEYNDRTPILVQPLFVMNADGTNQTEFYGNNSWWPVSLIHARGIPGTSKVMAIAAGHHTFQKGKVIVIDRSKGTQESVGIEFVAGASPDGSPGRKPAQIHENKWSKKLDGFGQAGFQFAHPYPLDEEEFLVSFTPDGYQGFVKYAEYLYQNKRGTPFGLYWMNREGDRELLASDPQKCCLQPIPVAQRPLPATRPSTVDYRKKSGTFYVQNIYNGPGLAGIKPGTIQKMRIVALEYRAAFVGSNRNVGPGGDSCCQTPIGIDNACWDIKHILGEVPIEKDGSAFFEIPALQPVYFQMIDAEGKMVQTMRSWTMVMPGEQLGCLGCHENKTDAGTAILAQKTTMAMKRPARKLSPFLGIPHPFIKRHETANSVADSLDTYLGINRPKMSNDPIEGFSYTKTVQPILDHHCVRCHDGSAKNDSGTPASSFILSGKPVNDTKAQRVFSLSYVNLTHQGNLTPMTNWIDAESAPPMLPPRFAGSSKSLLANYLQPEHYGVKLTATEKEAIFAWLDLGVPFCGSYLEAALWNNNEKTIYRYFQNKRLAAAKEELDALRKLSP